MLIIRKFNLLAFNPGHFFLVDIQISLLKFYTQGFQDGKAFHCRQQGDYKRKTLNGVRKSTRFKSRRGEFPRNPWNPPPATSLKATISLKNRRFDEKRATKSTFRGTGVPIERLIIYCGVSTLVFYRKSYTSIQYWFVTLVLLACVY